MFFSLMWNQNWENVEVLGPLLCTVVRLQSQKCYYFSRGFCCCSLLDASTQGTGPHVDAFYTACCSRKPPGDHPKHARLTEESWEFPNLVFAHEKKRRLCRCEQALADDCAQRSAQRGAQMWLTSVPSLPVSAHQLMSYNDLYLFSF